MSIARHRSIRKIVAFRERYFVEHTDAAWFDASFAYVMRAGRQRVGDVAECEQPDGREPVEYTTFVKTARAFAEASVEPPKPARERVVADLRLGFADAVATVLNAN